MASINDLAAAATIASSAVALQSSPTEPPAQLASLSSPPSPPPLSPSAAAPQSTPPPAPATQENPGPAQAPAAAPSSSSTPTTSIQPPPPQQPTPPPPASAVLAAPQISPQDAVSAQFPAPPAPPVGAPAATADDDDGATAAGGPGGAAAAGATTTPNGPDGGGPDGGADGAAPVRPKPVRGAFIVFEGMDRAGKTTQAKLLQQRCIEEGRDVRFMRFPDRTTPIGQMIDAYLRGQTEIEDHVIHLLFSANRWEALKTIQTTLAAGVSIICDRYYHSGIVYSAAKQNPALPLAWAKAPEVGLPRPDLVLFLDLDERVARERGGWGGEVYEKGEMQRRVRELFWGLSMGDLGAGGSRERRAASAPHGAGAVDKEDKNEFRQEEEDLNIIDADLPVEDLAEKVWAHVQPRLETVERGNVGAAVRTVH